VYPEILAVLLARLLTLPQSGNMGLQLHQFCASPGHHKVRYGQPRCVNGTQLIVLQPHLSPEAVHPATTAVAHQWCELIVFCRTCTAARVVPRVARGADHATSHVGQQQPGSPHGMNVVEVGVYAPWLPQAWKWQQSREKVQVVSHASAAVTARPITRPCNSLYTNPNPRQHPSTSCTSTPLPSPQHLTCPAATQSPHNARAGPHAPHDGTPGGRSAV
jgi:hypothetical protein